MAKKKVRAKNGRYKSFKLYGKYPVQTLMVYILLDLVVSVVLGLVIQSQVLQALASK